LRHSEAAAEESGPKGRTGAEPVLSHAEGLDPSKKHPEHISMHSGLS